jgi:hypothetical protein
VKSYLISVIVKFLLGQGLKYLDGNIDDIKADIEQFIIESIDPIWLEMVALQVFDSSWNLILGMVKNQLVSANAQAVSYAEQETLQYRSKLTAQLSKELC